MNTLGELNLARKWRPKTFANIIGQDVPVRMLKNGLFLKKFFPVYLFAGQRGCGKTSTARVFGAALNCHQLESFQKDPTINIPCLICESCVAMMNGHHPDFIEIDAASHTGVDNVRQIIDSSSYMPLIGKKKVYLIDEAHMLSKAAFNAFLKILEEPPMSVLFILATTETQKIPQTVLSRCFQVIFTPIENEHLKKHLYAICKQENITFDDTALDLLLAETEGSARDAINLLERVRFSCSHITEQTILSVLGKISNQELYTLFELALDQQPTKLLEHLHALSFETISPQTLWDMLIQLCRTILWIKYNATATLAPWIKNNEQLNQLAQKCSISRLHAIFQLFWTQEELFFKTNKKHAFLEMVLLQLCAQVNIVDLEQIIKSNTSGQSSSKPVHNIQRDPVIVPKPSADPVNVQATSPKPPQQNVAHIAREPWALFLQKITQLSDDLLSSIFAQAKAVGPHNTGNLFIAELNSNSKFFKEKLEECKKTWLPLFISCFPEYKDIHFQDPVISSSAPQQPLYQSIPPQKPAESATKSAYPTPRPPIGGQAPYKKANFGGKPTMQNAQLNTNINLEPINIDDKDAWPLANLIISHFPGKIRKLKE